MISLPGIPPTSKIDPDHGANRLDRAGATLQPLKSVALVSLKATFLPGHSALQKLELWKNSTDFDRLEPVWRSMQHSAPHWSSPYYSWEFLSAAATVRATEAVVLWQSGEPVGIWPFHRAEKQLGLPIGGALNDYHGPLVAPGVEFEPREFLRVAGLERFDFHSHYPVQASLEPFAFHRHLSRSWIDFKAGSEPYLEALAGRSIRVARQPQKNRKLAREIGELRLEVDSRDPADFAWVIETKREKYRRTGCTDFFAPVWCRELLALLWRARAENFRGLCSILWAGEQRVAGHFGMLANGILHYWYPVFSWAHARYSPGLELLLSMIRSAREAGYHTIDFGYGKEEFKQTVATHWEDVLVGSIDTSSARFHWNSWLENTRVRIKSSSYREMVRDLARTVVPNLGKPKVR